MREPKIDPRYLQDGAGKPSMMRLIAYHGARMARGVMALGMVLLPLELFVFRTGTTVGVSVIALGVGMFGLGEGAKAYQAGREK